MNDGENFIITHDPLDGLPIDLPETMRARPLARHIIAEVAAAHDVTPAEITGPRRFPHLVEARREAMTRVRNELGYSYPHIGRIFNRDHSSVIWSLRGGRFNQPKQERAA
jgi:chromosomal replication initiation ATPase DnaA